jgi:hypothetical protein
MANQVQGDGYEPDDMVEPEKDDATPERRVAGWQRALRWIAWLTFIGPWRSPIPIASPSVRSNSWR